MTPRRARLRAVVEESAELLPAQGPIGIFIHHNPLHAFESLDFDSAAIWASRRLSSEPYLPEAEYRDCFHDGRLTERDLRWSLLQSLGHDGDRRVAAGVTRLELRLLIARYGIPEASGPSLSWLLKETDVLRGWREDLPAEARGNLREGGARKLWDACLLAAQGWVPPRPPQATAPVRHRDLLAATHGIDTDAWVQPTLIRLLGAFLDQGLARWRLPGRSRGLYAAFLDLYAHPRAALCGPWARGLPGLADEERRRGSSAIDSLSGSLDALGVGPDEEHAFIEQTALALRGWAGMVRQLEARPDRVPARSVPASLVDYLAVRLLLERAALSFAASEIPGFMGGLAQLRPWLRERLPGAQAAPVEERAWRLFHCAQLCGFGPERVGTLAPAELVAMESELQEFRGVEVRRALQDAYDRHRRSRLYDALASRTPPEDPPAPAFQALFCLDEREESFRRHLEEVAPEVETFGTAGFFGIAMYFQGATDAHPRPLCPIAIQPKHYVGETRAFPSAALTRWRHVRRRGAGWWGRLVHRFGGTFLGGYVISTLWGPLSLAPLMVRVAFPGLFRRWARALPFQPHAMTRLLLDRREDAPPLGEHRGFSKHEMAEIVRGVLRGIGVADSIGTARLAPIVAVLGHGSTSLNNPHESAHDCGACGGGRGGPNARAFAQMANDPEVRARLAREGLKIPDETWFVGAQRNTADNSVDFYDLDLLPRRHEQSFDSLATAFGRARRREAHERCRRFEAFPFSGGHGAALSHVEERAHDLAQPRPEYGHASNAYCIVGRRRRTRGLFLDRRAFLVSYDPARDEDGEVLYRLLSAVVPVVAGISLEYYFSRVDPAGYGCSTKLPHNVACLLGVMDGAQSDLRTGLPWQMVEIHEPVRLPLVVECEPERFDAVLARLPGLRRLLDGRWLFAACLSPHSQELRVRGGSGWTPWTLEAPVPKAGGDSSSCYHGSRGNLPISEIVPGRARAA
ncbi:MAG: DUF2309 domain-containing protein [Elusimicrobia bacterium]|nr:DUF2309 domain-containing protein [Elusimicrobiota bacterium]